MQTKEELREEMVAEGFTIISEYDDPPNEYFPDHDHPGDQLLIVLTGSIEVTMDDTTSVLGPGERKYFPAGRVHSAKIGPEGCLYLDGEKPS